MIERKRKRCVKVDRHRFRQKIFEAFLAVMLIILAGRFLGGQDDEKEKNAAGNLLMLFFSEKLWDTVREDLIPEFYLIENGEKGNLLWIHKQIAEVLPVYEYLAQVRADEKRQMNGEEEESWSPKNGYESGMYIPGGDEAGISEGHAVHEKENDRNVQESSGQETTGETAQDEEELTWDEIMEYLQDENDTSQGEREDNGEKEMAEEEAGTQGGSPWDEVPEESNGTAGQSGFAARTDLVQTIDPEDLADFDDLVRRFYTVDESTTVRREDLNAEEFLAKDLTIDKNTDGPQILIYHTHSQEAYADSVAGDESTSVMGMGDRLAEILTETYGFKVLHHRGKYDVVSRDYAYTDALPEIEKILEDNPTIQVVIDLHRDAVPDHTRLCLDVDGRPTAKFMFFNGMGRLKNIENVSYLYNENLKDNLAMSFQMQMMSEQYYPGLARRIYLKGYRYNMHLKPRTMLIELGAQNNTVEEALNACDVIAFLLDKVLTKEE